MLTPRPAQYRDVLSMALRLRDEDKAELRAASGMTPLSALEHSFAATVLPHVGVDEGDQPVCMGGVVPFPGCPLRGAVWAVATTDVERHRVSFLRRSIPWVKRWQEQFPILTNCVDERNRVHIEWLRWLGFTFIHRHPEYGVERLPFLEFVRIDPLV
jgi:hypothetical protein